MQICVDPIGSLWEAWIMMLGSEDDFISRYDSADHRVNHAVIHSSNASSDVNILRYGWSSLAGQLDGWDGHAKEYGECEQTFANHFKICFWF